MEEYSEYYHWLFGDNILRKDCPNYIINLELGMSIRYDSKKAYWANYEEFYESIADVQFLSGQRPEGEELERVLIDAYNFMVLYDREEERQAIIRDLDSDI